MTFKSASILSLVLLVSLFSVRSFATDITGLNRTEEVATYFLNSANTKDSAINKAIEKIRATQKESLLADYRKLPVILTANNLQAVTLSRDEFVGHESQSYVDGKIEIVVQYHDFASVHRATVVESLRFECNYHAADDFAPAETIECLQQ
jgi:hypothetical protein